MRWLRAGVLLFAVLAIGASLAAWWNARRDDQSARRELTSVTRANEFLKKTLGEMTLAITARDREIDLLRHSTCEGRPRIPSGESAAK